MAKTINDYKLELEAQRKEYSRLAGEISAIHKYLDECGVDKIKPVHKRVKLFVMMWKKTIFDAARLEILLEHKE